MDPRITVITLGVADLARSVAFYRDGLGLPLEKSSNPDLAYFAMEGTRLALYPREALAEDAGIPAGRAEAAPGDRGFSGVTLSHNVRAREQVAEVLEHAVAAGGALVKAARDTSWGGTSGYFRDPDDHLWEVVWNPKWKID